MVLNFIMRHNTKIVGVLFIDSIACFHSARAAKAWCWNYNFQTNPVHTFLGAGSTELAF